MSEPSANRALSGAAGKITGPHPGAVLWRRELVGPAVLVAFWLAAILLVPPRGEFPINDDWDYFATVSDLLKHGEVRLSDWPAMTLVGQVMWGGLFAKLFGLSYMTLRFSVLTLFLAGALALYGWARTIGRDRVESLFLGLLYATCPLAFSLSYSFMTDVPGASLMLVCLFVQAVCARKGGTALHALAGMTAAAGYLVRQTAALPAVVLAVSMIPGAIRSRQSRREFAALILPLAIVMVSHRYWLDHVHGRPYQAGLERLPLIEVIVGLESWTIFWPMLVQLILWMLMLCIYLAPLLLMLVGKRAWVSVWRSWGAWIAASVVLLGVPWILGFKGGGSARLPVRLPPVHTRYVEDSHIGFESVAGFGNLKYPRLPVVSFSIGCFSVGLVTILALFSASLAAAFLFVSFRDRARRWLSGKRVTLPFSPAVQAGLCALFLVGLLMMQPNRFDRYLVPIVPLGAMVLLLLLPLGGRWLRTAAPWLLLTAYAMVSVAGTQDYFVRGRTRLAAVTSLLQSGVRPEDISAGLEHAGVYRFSPRYRREAHVRPDLLDVPSTERWRRLKTEDPTMTYKRRREYELRYDLLLGKAPIRVFPYRSWIRSGNVFIYHWPEERRAASYNSPR